MFGLLKEKNLQILFPLFSMTRIWDKGIYEEIGVIGIDGLEEVFKMIKEVVEHFYKEHNLNVKPKEWVFGVKLKKYGLEINLFSDNLWKNHIEEIYEKLKEISEKSKGVYNNKNCKDEDYDG